MEKKQCTKCKEWKEFKYFHKRKASKDGLRSWCKECRKKYENYYVENKSKILKQCKKYRELNPEFQKEYNEKNKEKQSKKGKKYRNSPIKFKSKSKYRQEIGIYEEEIRESTEGYLQCKCAYCGDWFNPTYLSIRNRTRAVNNENYGECRLYCSEPCKQSCPTYNQQLYPKGFKPATSREVQPELRQMVLLRDNYTCQRCGKHKDELSEECIALHCHHLEGIQWEPLMSADMDMCITYCQPCHVKAHQTPDCSYHDQQCK